MIAKRRAASATAPSAKLPWLSGPRWTSVSLIAATRAGSTAPSDEAIPQMPHIATSLGGPGERPGRLGEDAPGRCREGAQIEPHRAIGDPLEIVRQLLGHRRLVAAADLREAGQAGTDDQSLPVRRQVGGKLLEEARADRARPDEAHVSLEHVPELRDLVDLGRAQPAAERRDLGLGSFDERWAEEVADPLLGARVQGAELEHREDPAGPADPLAAIEDRATGREELRDGDRDGDG